jgi:WD40 repeat protein
MLIEPESIDCYQLMGRFAVHHEVERFKSLSVLALAESSAPTTVTSISGFAGRQRVVSVAALGKRASDIADKKQVVSPEMLARIAAVEDAITISNTGRYAIVREVQSAPTLAIYDLTSNQLRGEKHLTESLLIDRPLAKSTDGSLGILGQARFNPTDELFVYRLNRDALGLVLMESGKRVGKPLLLSEGRLIHEVGWSADSKTVWAVTSKNESQYRVELWDVASGELRSREIGFKARIVSGLLSKSGRKLILYSEKGETCILDTIVCTVAPLLTSNDSLQGRAGFWGPAENIYLLVRNRDKNAPIVTFWSQPTSEPTTAPFDTSRDSNLVLPISQGTIAFEGFMDLDNLSGSSVQQIKFWELDAKSFRESKIESPSGFRALQVAPGGRLILTTENSGRAQIWHALSGHPLGPAISDIILWPPGMDASLSRREYIFSPDGSRLFALQDARVVSLLTVEPR